MFRGYVGPGHGHDNGLAGRGTTRSTQLAFDTFLIIIHTRVPLYSLP